MFDNSIDNNIKSSYVSDIKQGYILSKIILDKKDKSKVLDGMILDTNENLIELLDIAGISATDTLKKVMSHMIDSQFKEFLDLYSKAALEKKQKSLIQYSEKLKSWISIDMISPQPDYVMLIFTDVTDEINKEKHIENLVKYQKQLAELFFNSISDMLLVVSKDERIVFANKAFYEITDNKYELGIKLDELYPKENKQKFNNILKEIKNELVETKAPVSKRIDWFEDEISYIDLSANLEVWNNVEHIFLVVCIRNIYTLKRIKELLNYHFNMSLENIAMLVPLAAATKQKEIKADNLIIEKLSLINKDIATNATENGLTFKIISTDDNLDLIKEIKHKKILNNIPATLLTNTGIEIPMIYSAIILKLWETEYCFIVLKEAKKTEKDLEDALEQQSNFLSMVVHDLKGPIGGCASYIKELSENLQLLSQEEIEERVAYLSTSSENIYRLLEDLLEWSRIECKTVDFNLDTTIPHIIVNTIISTMLLNAKYKHLKLINNIDSNLTIQADAKMLSTILRNLISNAVKFTNKDGKIIISHTENKDFHIISVSDDGIGMSEDIKNNLFKNPSCTSRTGTAGETSTELGLVICKEYVEKHGGKIWVESEENKGTTFYFTIPRKDEKI
ncbi:MAG: ATP-binding protein [Candidatus Kapaibacterium sp.]